MVRFTVVTITYNAERVLQRTLDSVLSQTYEGVEHVIVDGASKDGTLALAERYKQQSDASASGHEVVILSEPDNGIYDAMNKGLRRATGDYIVFMNAGDAFHAADTLQTVANAIPSDSSVLPAVIYGDTAITDGDGHFLHLRRLRPPQVLTWRSFRQGMLVCHQAFYAQLDIARPIEYDLQYRHSADVDWCIRVMKEAERQQLPLVNTHTVLADFEDGGNTTQNHRASLLERYRVMVAHYGLLQATAMHAWFVVRAVLARLRRK